jgi:hypothetical protein
VSARAAAPSKRAMDGFMGTPGGWKGVVPVEDGQALAIYDTSVKASTISGNLARPTP